MKQKMIERSKKMQAETGNHIAWCGNQVAYNATVEELVAFMQEIGKTNNLDDIEYMQQKVARVINFELETNKL